MATDLKLNTNNPYSRGYIVELEDSKSLLKRERAEYNPLVNRDKIHTFKDGDTLWDLAFQLYGSSKLWYIIADANSITNPMEIATNTALVLPDIDVAKLS